MKSKRRPRRAPRTGLGASDPCAWPERPTGEVPRFDDLPERVIGCRYAAHGNSTARSADKPPRTALSMHANPRGNTLFNVHAPVVFDDAVLYVNQTAAKFAARQQLQKVVWPTAKACATAEDCIPRRDGKLVDKVRMAPIWDPVARRWAESPTPVCKLAKKPSKDPNKPSGSCYNVRRLKTPMGYVDGHVYPDDGDRRPTSIAFFAGECQDWDTQGRCQNWDEAKYIDAQCMRGGNPAACPAVGVRDPATPPGSGWTRFGKGVANGRLVPFRSVRFVPNSTDPRANEDGSPQPFSVTLEGRRSKRYVRRRP